MSFRHYKAEDFFHDPNFRKWVLHPDPELNFFWEKWLCRHPEKEEEVALAHNMVKVVQITEYEWDDVKKTQLWLRIIQTNQKQANSGNKKVKFVNLPHYNRSKTKSKKSINIWLKAAVVSGLFLAGTYIANLEVDQSGGQSEEPQVAMVEKHNANGQKSRIFLPDGSVVYLNSNSSLTYPQQFQEGKRQVRLSGEAFFEVVKDSISPFLVESNQMVVKVLGTSFTVKDFPGGRNIKVSLVEGSLKVISKENNRELLLQPGQSVTGDKESYQYITGVSDYLCDAAWKDGILNFKETALDEAFATLEQWYGVRFTFNKPPLQDVEITGKFDNEYLTNVLKSLSYSVTFNYEIKNGNDVQIVFN